MDLQWHVRRPGAGRRGARGAEASLIAGLIFSVLGLGFLGVGATVTLTTVHFLSKSISTPGTVTKLREVNDAQNHSTTYAPVFRFEAKNGQSYSIVSHSSSNPPGYEVGETVRVLYDPANPAGAQIDSLWELWGIAMVFGIIGGVFAFAGLTLLLLSRLQKRRKARAWAGNSVSAIHPE